MSTVFMPAPNTVVMAIPAKTTVKRDVFAPSEIPKMISAVTSAPRNAANGGSHKTLGNTLAAISTNKPAPELMPMTLGLASGLSSTAWMMAPETASAEPAKSAASTRGKRTFTRMLFAAALTSPPVAHVTSSAKLTDDDPTKNAAAVTAARTMTEASVAKGAACPRSKGDTSSTPPYAYSASNSTW